VRLRGVGDVPQPFLSYNQLIVLVTLDRGPR
jgi:hypothetical protein